MSDVPDCVFPSSNSEGIADLLMEDALGNSLQGDVLDYPAQWGKFARSTDIQPRKIATLEMWC
jgi:hypothetical protein